MRIRHARNGQAGFSMIEMLMTAFVLAIGILGLTLLQTMSLRASRGSRSLSTGLLVGQRVMDQIEMEGRLSWLNATNTDQATPALTDMAGLQYVTLADGGTKKETFNSSGGTVDTTSADPAVKFTFYTVTTTRTALAATTTGKSSDFNVAVVFSDAVNGTNVPIKRTVSLTRRIIHG